MLVQFLIVAAGCIAFATVTCLVVLTVARRHAEVSVRHRVGVPLRWLLHPGECASLTRRLRRSVAAVHAVIPAPRRRHEPSRPQELAEPLELLAAAPARGIVSASFLPRWTRGRELVGLRAQVLQVESMSRRLVADAAALDPDRPDPAEWSRRMQFLDEELAAREAARRELAFIERAGGLVAQVDEPEAAASGESDLSAPPAPEL
jgi:hypothetical protein